MDNVYVLQKQLSICTHTVVITILQAWDREAELQYYGKIQIQNTNTEVASTFPESSKFRRLLDGKVDDV